MGFKIVYPAMRKDDGNSSSGRSRSKPGCRKRRRRRCGGRSRGSRS